MLKADVWTDGFAHNFRVVQSLGYGLDQRAIDAVTKWRFRPGTKDGKPVAVVAQFEVDFRLMREIRDSDRPSSSGPPRISEEHKPISSDLAEQSAAYLQRQLHVWQTTDAQAELGQPTGHRIAADQAGGPFRGCVWRAASCR
jgi:hypothetical protein